MKKTMMIMLAAVLIAGVVSSASADLLVGDTVLQTVTRYTDDGVVIWQRTGMRSVAEIEVMPNGNFMVACNYTDRIAWELDADTGATLSRPVPAGDYVNDVMYGHDYDGDGNGDIWMVSRNAMRVYSGVWTRSGTSSSPTLLAESIIADVNLNDGTGGNSLCFGPDHNNDGIADIYVGKGGNSQLNRINVFDPTNLSSIASYAVSQPLAISDMEIGPDGKLYAGDVYRNGVHRYEPDTMAYIDRPLDATDCALPQSFDFAEDGYFYLGNRFASSRSTFPAVQRYDAATMTYVDTPIEHEGGLISAVTYVVPEPMTLALLGLGGLLLRRRR